MKRGMRRAWREDIKYRKVHKKKERVMDPDEALRQIRLTAKQLQVDVTRDIKIQHADDLAELILGLDEWLTSGGFLPTDWTDECNHNCDPNRLRPAEEKHFLDCPVWNFNKEKHDAQSTSQDGEEDDQAHVVSTEAPTEDRPE